MIKQVTLILLLLTTITISKTLKAQTYCTPTYTFGCSSGDYIDGFSTTGGVTNITNLLSGCASAGIGYSDYTTMIHQGLIGTTVTFTINNCPTWSQGYKIYVDWNENGTLNDAGEIVYDAANTLAGGSSVTASFNIPLTAAPGPKRMRIRGVFAGTTFDPCNLQSFGETEDYTLEVIGSDDNLGAFALVSPNLNEPYCSGPNKLLVKVKSFSTNTINNFQIGYSIGGVQLNILPFIHTFNGYNQTADFELGYVNLPYNIPTEVKIYTHLPNNNPDPQNSNDTLTVVLTATKLGVVLNPLPDTFMCKGSSITLDAGTNVNCDYTWSNGTQAQHNTINTIGTHWVWAYNTEGCVNFDTFDISYAPEIKADIYLSVIDNLNGSFLFNMSGVQNVITYIWDFGDSSPKEFGAGPKQHLYLNDGVYNVVLAMTNGCDTIYREEKVQVAKTSVQDINKSAAVKVYPNPANEQINISKTDPDMIITNVQIINAIGQEVYTSKNTAQIDVQKLPRGIYTLVIDSNKGKMQQKLILE